MSPMADLAIGPQDVVVKRTNGTALIAVTVHNIGVAKSKETNLTLSNSNGDVLARTKVPPINWPADLQAKTTLVTVTISLDKLGIDFIVEIDPEGKIKDAVRLNNRITAITPKYQVNSGFPGSKFRFYILNYTFLEKMIHLNRLRY